MLHLNIGELFNTEAESSNSWGWNSDAWGNCGDIVLNQLDVTNDDWKDDDMTTDDMDHMCGMCGMDDNRDQHFSDGQTVFNCGQIPLRDVLSFVCPNQFELLGRNDDEDEAMTDEKAEEDDEDEAMTDEKADEEYPTVLEAVGLSPRNAKTSKKRSRRSRKKGNWQRLEVPLRFQSFAETVRNLEVERWHIRVCLPDLRLPALTRQAGGLPTRCH